MLPDIQFAKSGDVYIAYQVVGNGPVDLVYIPDWRSGVRVRCGLKGMRGPWRIYRLVEG